MAQQFGSLVNIVIDKKKGCEPQVGMGVTHCGWSDRDPYEIIEVIDDRHIVVRELDAICLTENAYFSESQEYEYKSNPQNRTERLYKNNKGRWVRRIGRNGVDNYGSWYIGSAEKYYDPYF